MTNNEQTKAEKLAEQIASKFKYVFSENFAQKLEQEIVDALNQATSELRAENERIQAEKQILTDGLHDIEHTSDEILVVDMARKLRNQQEAGIMISTLNEVTYERDQAQAQVAALKSCLLKIHETVGERKFDKYTAFLEADNMLKSIFMLAEKALDDTQATPDAVTTLNQIIKDLKRERHIAKQTDQLNKNRLDKLQGLLATLRANTSKAQMLLSTELNLSNYTPDDVAKLNNNAIEAYDILDKAGDHLYFMTEEYKEEVQQKGFEEGVRKFVVLVGAKLTRAADSEIQIENQSFPALTLGNAFGCVEKTTEELLTEKGGDK